MLKGSWHRFQRLDTDHDGDDDAPRGSLPIHQRCGHNVLALRIKALVVALDVECLLLKTGDMKADFEGLIKSFKKIQTMLDFVRRVTRHIEDDKALDRALGMGGDGGAGMRV